MNVYFVDLRINDLKKVLRNLLKNSHISEEVIKWEISKGITKQMKRMSKSNSSIIPLVKLFVIDG
jgi:hypothetical protein